MAERSKRDRDEAKTPNPNSQSEAASIGPSEPATAESSERRKPQPGAIATAISSIKGRFTARRPDNPGSALIEEGNTAAPADAATPAAADLHAAGKPIQPAIVGRMDDHATMRSAPAAEPIFVDIIPPADIGPPPKIADLCAGARSQDDLLAALIAAVRAIRRRLGSDTLAECQYFAAADAKLGEIAKRQFKADLRIDRTGFVRRVEIGRDKRLFRPQIQHLLPSSYTTLYEIHLLRDQQLADAIADGTIHPGMTRESVKRWKQERGDHGAVHRTMTGKHDVLIDLPEDMSEAERSEAEIFLEEYCDSIGATIRFPIVEAEIAAEDRIATRWGREVDRGVRARAQALVKTTKQEKLRQRPDHIGKKQWQQQARPYSPEQTRIDANADMDEVREVLNLIGKSDELAWIQQEAEDGATLKIRSYLAKRKPN